MKSNKQGNLIIYLIIALVVILLVAAWVTHVSACFKAHEYFYLIAGAVAAPVGIIHGFGIWFGLW